jgi:hypothetical protein
MLNERDEFLLSRLPDGDLSEDEDAHVQTLLASSAAARELVEEYRRLAGALAAEAVPEFDFAGAQSEIFAALDAESRTVTPMVVDARSRSVWARAGVRASRRMAIAAVMLAGIAVSIHYLAPRGGGGSDAGHAGAGGGASVATSLDVSGPRAEPSTGTLNLTVGPSPAIANVPPDQLYSDDASHIRPRVMVAPESAPAKDNSPHDPF